MLSEESELYSFFRPLRHPVVMPFLGAHTVVHNETLFFGRILTKILLTIRNMKFPQNPHGESFGMRRQVVSIAPLRLDARLPTTA